MNSITLATFDRLEPAEALKHRLEHDGIHAAIHDESRLQRLWFMSAPHAAIKVEVEHPDFETARHRLEDWDQSEPCLQEAVRCPQCHSSRIEYPQFTRKFITPVLVELFVFLRIVPREFYCQDCHFTWPKERSVDPDRDLLGWPRRPDLTESRSQTSPIVPPDSAS